MVRRIASLALLVVGIVAMPVRAAAQTAPAQESEAGIPYARVDTGEDNPYRRLDFEERGAEMPVLDDAIFAASDADDVQLQLAAVTDLGGFQDAVVGASGIAEGVTLIGVSAPQVDEGSLLTTTTGAGPSTTVGDGTAIPELANDQGDDGRSSFAFTDDSGDPTPPPDDLPPLADPPAPPSEGIDATPATTTTTSPAPPITTAPAPTTTSPAPTTTSPSPATTITAAPTTTTTSRPNTTTTSTTAAPTTTTTSRPPTTTTTTRPPTTTTTTSPVPVTTTTTTIPTTTTTVVPPTTTTTSPPPSDSITLTQERPSATACIAPSGGTQTCDAIWSVPLAATGQTRSFDITLRNDGNVDASALELWASSSCVTTSTSTPSGTGDLCGAVQLTVQRFGSAERDVPVECVYGGGTAQVCSLSSSRSLAHFSSTYPSAAGARAVGSGLGDGDACYLRMTLRLPDVDNRFQRRAATMSLTWRQVQ